MSLFIKNRRVNAKQKSTNIILFIVIISVFLISISYRLLVADIMITPDSYSYLQIANNIIENGCFSSSDVASASCVPCWGRQPPGYPLFIGILSLFWKDVFAAAAIAQIIIFGLAVAYFTKQIAAWQKSIFVAAFVGIILAVSPLAAAWSKAALSETLAAATTLWVFAELIFILRTGRVPWLRLSLALVCALSIRWDQIWLLLAAAFIITREVTFRIALRRLVIFSLFVLSLLTVLEVRAAMLGLPPVPPQTIDNALPPGVLKFWRVTSLTQDVTRSFIWRIWGGKYKRVEEMFNYEALARGVDRGKAEDLISEIGNLPDKSDFPPSLDKAFSDVADDYYNKNKIYVLSILPIERAIHMWTEKDAVYENYHIDHIENIRKNLRIMLFIGFSILFFIGWKMEISALIYASFIYIAVRNLFLTSSHVTALEIRYLVPMYPIIEITVATAIALLLRNWGRVVETRFCKSKSSVND